MGRDATIVTYSAMVHESLACAEELATEGWEIEVIDLRSIKPLDTDTVIAEAFTGRLVARWGETYDLWRLPAVAIGLSREHDWAPGTLSLSVAGMTAYLRDLASEIARSLPTRNLLVINGHGGNRGILEALGREWRGDFGLNVVALHLGALISPVTDAASNGRGRITRPSALAPAAWANRSS